MTKSTLPFDLIDKKMLSKVAKAANKAQKELVDKAAKQGKKQMAMGTWRCPECKKIFSDAMEHDCTPEADWESRFDKEFNHGSYWTFETDDGVRELKQFIAKEIAKAYQEGYKKKANEIIAELMGKGMKDL